MIATVLLQHAGKRGVAGLAARLPRSRGRYLRLLTEVPRFYRAARRRSGLYEGGEATQTQGDFLRVDGFSRYFTAVRPAAEVATAR